MLTTNRAGGRRAEAGRLTLRAAMLLSTAAVVVASLSSGVAGVSTQAASAPQTFTPNASNNLDCNGWSSKYQPISPNFKMRCVDPISLKGYDGHPGRAIDNGHYVGHDEPSVRFLSNSANSGNSMSYYMQLPVDPTAKATANGSVTDYAELSVAPWFGLPICDPNSFAAFYNTSGSAMVNNTCTRDSDGNNANSNGTAFMELQFYAPGYAPFLDGPSCDQTRYCAALNIDSLTMICSTGTFNANTCSPNSSCLEPVNFAFLTLDGTPTGPPNPQTADALTQTPNNDTLYMNPGDTVKVSITDTSVDGSLPALTTTVQDFTTGQTGFMQASAANGFATTNPNTCAGTAFNFHASYATATTTNTVAWSALEGGVLMEDEIGHGESCASLSNTSPANFSYPDHNNFSDPNTFATCNGGQEGASATGEGPCDSSTGVCTGATTEAGAACPDPNYQTGTTACEFSDGFCLPAGARTVTIGSVHHTYNLQTNLCGQTENQNGDLDFDGNSYIPDWPNGSDGYPRTFRYLGPFDPAGAQYPNLQFETDAPGSESLCNPSAPTAQTCKVPAQGAAFYPFWSVNNTPGNSLAGMRYAVANAAPCVWNFGNDITGVTGNDFSQDAQYGTPDTSHYGGTLLSASMPNPTDGNHVSGSSGPICTAVTQSQLSFSPFNTLDQLDAYGNVFSIPASGSRTVTSTGALFGFNIARSMALVNHGSGGYILDGWGGIHPFGSANPAFHQTAYWKGWDIARSIVVLPDGSGGYVFDGWGGAHPFSIGSNPVPPALSGLPYWRGWDILRGVQLASATSGYVLDGWGGVHNFGGATAFTNGPYFRGYDIARSIVLDQDNLGGYVLDGLGGVHAIGNARHVPVSAYWSWDIARSLIVEPGTTDQGWVLDGYGGLHPFGDAPFLPVNHYTNGQDIQKSLGGS